MTIINNTGLNSSASLLAQQFAKRSTRQAAKTQPSAPAPAAPASAQPDSSNLYSTLASLMNKWSDAKQAIDRLNHAPQDIKQSRKAAAAEMIQRIKDQIKLLLMMGGGDPKARAQQIAQLARQLAAAAREYASASGGDSQESNAATPEASADGGTTTASSATPASPAESPGSSQQVGEQIGSTVSERSDASAESQADREFAMEVRKLEAQLKALAKQTEVHSPKAPEKSTDREMANTDEALKEVERSLSSLDSADTSVSASIVPSHHG